MLQRWEYVPRVVIERALILDPAYPSEPVEILNYMCVCSECLARYGTPGREAT